MNVLIGLSAARSKSGKKITSNLCSNDTSNWRLLQCPTRVGVGHRHFDHVHIDAKVFVLVYVSELYSSKLSSYYENGGRLKGNCQSYCTKQSTKWFPTLYKALIKSHIKNPFNIKSPFPFPLYINKQANPKLNQQAEKKNFLSIRKFQNISATNNKNHKAQKASLMN